MRQAPLKNKHLKSIFIIIFLDEIGMTIGFPILTFLCFDKKSSLFAASVTHAVRSYWYGIFNSLPFMVALVAVPLLSWLSDYYGRKKILLIGSLGVLAFSVFTTFSILYGTITLLVIGCIVNGLFTRVEPTALAVVGDCSNYNNKVTNMGFLQFCISTGAFLGPLIGGYFAERFLFKQLNFSLPYIIGASFAFLSFLFVLFTFKETFCKPIKRKVRFTKILQLFRNPQIIKISILLLLTQISWRIYYQFIPPVLKVHFHYAPQTIGIFIALIAVWLAIASSFGLKLLDKLFTAKKILYGSCSAVFIGLLLAIVANQLHPGILSQILTWLAVIPIAMGDVITYSLITTLYSNAVSEYDQGKIMGINYIIYGSVWAMTGLVGGALAAININAPIIFAPIGLVLLFILFIIFRGLKLCT